MKKRDPDTSSKQHEMGKGIKSKSTHPLPEQTFESKSRITPVLPAFLVQMCGARIRSKKNGRSIPFQEKRHVMRERSCLLALLVRCTVQESEAEKARAHSLSKSREVS